MQIKTKMKRSVVFALVAAALAALLLAGFTLAYLTDRRETLNVLNIGRVNIALEEAGFAAQAEAMDDTATITKVNEGTAEEYTLVTMNNVLPGQPINKDPVVKNLSPMDVYIRVKLFDSDAEGANEVDLAASPYSLLNAALATGWEKSSDGYLYYTSPVAPTGSGDGIPLFAENQLAAAMDGYPEDYPYTMMLPATLTNDDFDRAENPLAQIVNLFVVAEAIQASGITTDFTDVETTPPWPGGVTVTPAARI